MDIDQLETRIQALLGSQQPSGDPVHVEWRLNEYDPKIKAINDALKRADEKERFDLTKELLNVYLTQEAPTVERLFGHLPEKGDRRIMGTVVAGGRQFRIWQGLPAYVSPDFADSCGKNLVVGIYGELTQRYVEELLPAREGYVDFLDYRGCRIRIKGG